MLKRHTSLFGLAVLCLSYSTFSWGQVNEGDNTHEYALDNGLKLIVRVDSRAPVAVSQIWYKVGSSFEPGGITGVSHVLEHLLFKGTEAFPEDSYGKLVSSYGGNYNAFTSQDMTVYYQELPADKLATSFELEADRMRNITIDADEFATELEVVKEERRLRTEDQPQSLLLERLNAAAFISSPYHHPVIGWMDDLEHMTLEDALNWYHQWYSPNNVTIVVVGDVDPDEVYQLADQYFGSIEVSNITTPKPQREVPPLGERRLTVARPAQLPHLMMGYNVPTLMTAEEDWEPYALDVIANILSGGQSTRLAKTLVRDQAIAVSASAYYDPLDRLSTLFLISAVPTPEYSVSDLEAALLDQISQLQQVLIEQEELDRVITGMKAQDIFSKDSMTQQGLVLGRLDIVGLPWQLDADYIEHVEALTPAQIQAIAVKYLTPDRLTVAQLDPQPLSDLPIEPVQGGDTDA